LIILVLAILSFWAWKTERWHVIAINAAVLFLHWICWHARYDRAHEIIIFFGDGGALVLGTLLMMTLYVPRESPVYQNELRWGFLAVGAAAFVDAFHTWSGREEDIPFGVQEGTQTDPSQLVENYGWTIPGMMPQVRSAGGAVPSSARGCVRSRHYPSPQKVELRDGAISLL
jgi:hypothetical protein